MKNLLKAENFIRKAFLSDDEILIQTCKLFLWHFSAVDSIENTCHCRAIGFLYRCKNTKRTKQSIADEIFSNVKSLKFAREKYVAYFFYFYNQVRNKSVAAEAAIASAR